MYRFRAHPCGRSVPAGRETDNSERKTRNRQRITPNSVFRSWVFRQPGRACKFRPMTTHRAIVDALFKSVNASESVVLATVVRITGSSYGGVGTRMVARVDGSTVGVVSGGCLETDLAEHAREVHAT